MPQEFDVNIKNKLRIKKTGWDYAPIIFAITISLAALIFTGYQAALIHNQHKCLIKPYLNPVFDRSLSPFRASLSITNLGFGPAKITSFKVFDGNIELNFDPKKFDDSWKQILDKVKLSHYDIAFGLFDKDTIIADGRKLTILKLREENANLERVKEFENKIINKLNFIFCYSDLEDEQCSYTVVG